MNEKLLFFPLFFVQITKNRIMPDANRERPAMIRILAASSWARDVCQRSRSLDFQDYNAQTFFRRPARFLLQAFQSQHIRQTSYGAILFHLHTVPVLHSAMKWISFSNRKTSCGHHAFSHQQCIELPGRYIPVLEIHCG